MNAPPPLDDPRELAGTLEGAITDALGQDRGPSKSLRAILVEAIADRAAKMAATAPPPDPEALAKLAAEMEDDLDQLEDLLEALALTAGPGRAG